MTGGGGSGKTRLGREACVQMLMVGWDAGLADDQRRDGTPTDRLQRPTLLVVDDADLRTGLISALVGYLRWDDAGPPVRLLLLARAAGTWWDRLVRQQDLDGACTVLDLDRHPVPPADRAEHFRRASTAFAAYRDPGAPPADLLPPSGLNDPAYAEPLLIQIAALLCTVDTPATPPTGPGGERAASSDSGAVKSGLPVRQTLLQALCERERTRWYQLGSHLSFNPDLPLVDQVVALATLTAAADQPGAMSLLSAVPNQAEVTRIGAEALVVWVHRLYSGPGYWNPLRPDLLAEQHLADTAQLSALATAAAQLAVGQQREAALLTRLLAELTRGAPNQPAIQDALDELLASAVPRIVYLAVTAGHADLADQASLALQLAPQPGPAAQLADQMPEHSVQLAALAATLASQQVTHYRSGKARERPDAASRLAGSLNNLSVRLGNLGRREDALAAIQEAVAIRRELAAARPDAFRPALATALTNLSNQLAGLGRREDALAAVQEAVAIRRELAAARPDAFRPGLAAALHSLSNQLAGLAGGRTRWLRARRPQHLPGAGCGPPGRVPARPGRGADQPVEPAGRPGRREDALAASAEASSIYRELAAARPDAFQPDLAAALTSLSNRLASLGRREDALAASAEASSVYRELAAARPDAFQPDLAKSLNNLSADLSGLGGPEDALAAIQEAADTYRELAAARPDAFRPDLAKSLNNRAIYLRELGGPEDALAAIREATNTYRELAAARPDAFQPDLAWSLNNLAVLLASLGWLEDALAAIREATSIYRELAAARPDAFRPDLAMSLINLAVYLGELGRREDALTTSAEATHIFRELAARWPDAYQQELEQSLQVVAWLEQSTDVDNASPEEPKT